MGVRVSRGLCPAQGPHSALLTAHNPPQGPGLSSLSQGAVARFSPAGLLWDLGWGPRTWLRILMAQTGPSPQPRGHSPPAPAGEGGQPEGALVPTYASPSRTRPRGSTAALSRRRGRAWGPLARQRHLPGSPFGERLSPWGRHPRQSPSCRAGGGEWDFTIAEWTQAPAPAEAKFEEGR